MGRIELTTQELLLRLGPTAQSRRARADALFRKLRIDQQDEVEGALSGAPKRVDAKTLKAKKVSETCVAKAPTPPTD